MATISKADLIKNVAYEVNLSAKDVKVIVNAFLEQTMAHLTHGEKVQLTSFGAFEVRERLARVGVRPFTTEKIQIPARKYAAFKAGKTLRDSIK